MDPRVVELHKQAAARSDVLSLAGGLPADELLPHAELATAMVEAASGMALQYGWPEGAHDLRAWIAARLAGRGADVDPERVIVTAGAQQALAIAGRALRGCAIAVGEATYSGAIDAFTRAGARVVSSGGDARYVIAGVGNPTGVDVCDRDALLATSEPLIVDEAYAELRFDGRVPRPLLADAPDRVWHVGTISKTIAPGLRVGWLIPPPAEHAAALDLKHAADLQTASISQDALARMLGQLSYDAMLQRARAYYAERAACLVEAVQAHIGGIRFRAPEGGFSIWVETDDEGDELALLVAALDERVTFDPGNAFRPHPSDCVAFRLSYSNQPPAAFPEAARRLDRALARWRRTRQPFTIAS